MAATADDNPMGQLARASKDLAHITVGLAVLAFQKVQVQRRSVERAMAAAGLDPRRRMQQFSRCGSDQN